MAVSAVWRRREVALAGRGEAARLACYDGGDPDRPADVVFLHANGFNAATYSSILAPLAAELRILILDQQGHGGSAQRVAAEGRTDWLDLRADLLAFLDAVSPGRPVILSGHSMGGCVSILAAAEQPRCCTALALFDPVILAEDVSRRVIASGAPMSAENSLAERALTRRSNFPSHEAAFESYRGRGPFAAWSDQMVRDYVDDGFRPAAGGGVELACAPEWEASNFRAHAHDTWGALRALKAPLTILRAETGSTCALADAAELPGVDVRVAIMPGATHFLPMERPDEVRRVILETADVQEL